MTANKPRSKFVQESQAASQQVSTMMQLFQPKPGEVDADAAYGVKKIERRNLPPMIKPGAVPVGTTISGEIVKIVDSPVSTIKGKLLHLKHHSGTEFTFPCTGVIRSALAPGVKDEGEALTRALEKEVGKVLFAKRLPDQMSSKFKKSMYMFDVATAPK